MSLTNIDITKPHSVSINLESKITGVVKGTYLTSQDVRDHNTFENPDKIKPQTFSDFKLNGNNLESNIPPHSVVVLEIK